VDLDRTAQVTFILGGFFRQDVALESLATLDGTAGTNAKTLFRAAFGFHLWHAHIHPIEGGSLLDDDRWQNKLHLDACSRFL
jgi:hypothetical protein